MAVQIERKYMDVRVIVRLSRPLHPKLHDIKIGRYLIKRLPSDESLGGRTHHYLLEYEDVYLPGDTPSQPEKESRLFISFIAMLLRTRISVESLMINSVNIGPAHRQEGYKIYQNELEELPDFESALSNITRMSPETAELFLRACEVYRLALNNIGKNDTLSFLLFTVAVECLSTKYGTGNGISAKFIQFIKARAKESIEGISEQNLVSILNNVYDKYRCAFVHHGKEIPAAPFAADIAGKPYIEHLEKGKPRKAPSLVWFESVVRECLYKFLEEEIGKASNATYNHFKNLSMDYGMVTMKRTKSKDKSE